MAKVWKVKLVESNELEITSKAREMLENLSVQVVSLPPDPILKERFDLPFVETEDGHRYFGLQGITRFAQGITQIK